MLALAVFVLFQLTVQLASTNAPIYYGVSECEVRLKCDPLSSLEDSVNKELDFKWKVPQHLQKQPQVTFIQTKDLLKIPVAKVGYSGIYQCEVYVNGLPQSTIEQELIVVNQLPPNIYKEFEMKFPDRQCRYNDKYTYQRIRRDVKHLFGNTDSMNIYFYTSHWHCDTNKKKVQFRFYPKLPLTTVIEGKSTPTAVIQEATNTMQRVYDAGKESLVSFLMDGEELSQTQADKLVDGFPTEIQTKDKSARSRLTCDTGLYKDDEDLVCLPCRAGQRYNSGKKTCEACPASTYQDEYGMTSCRPCQDGGVNDKRTACLRNAKKPTDTIPLQNIVPTVYGLEGFALNLFCNPDQGANNTLPKWKQMEWQIPSRIVNDIQTSDDKLMFKSVRLAHSGKYSCNIVTEHQVSIGFIQEVLILQPPSKPYFGELPMEFGSETCQNGGKSKDVRDRLQEYICPKMQGAGCGIDFRNYVCDTGPGTYKGAMFPVLPTDTVFENCLTDRCVLDKVLVTLQHGLDVTVPKVIEYLKGTSYYNTKPMQGAAEIDKVVKMKWYKYGIAKFGGQTCNKGYQLGFNRLICVPCKPGFYISSDTCQPCKAPRYSLYGYSYCKSCTETLEGKDKSCPEFRTWEKDVKVIDALNTQPSKQKDKPRGFDAFVADYPEYIEADAQEAEVKEKESINRIKSIGIGGSVGVLVLIILVCICRAKCSKKSDKTPADQELVTEDETNVKQALTQDYTEADNLVPQQPTYQPPNMYAPQNTFPMMPQGPYYPGFTGPHQGY